MPTLRAILIAALSSLAAAQTVNFPTQDGGLIYADSYGSGPRAVVLAHGARYNKESWEKQAKTIATAGFHVLAIDFRGVGKSKGPEGGRRFDVLAAVHYLRKTGAKSVGVVGASMGGEMSAAAAEAEPDAIDRLVLLASGWGTTLTKMKGRKLFILAQDDPVARLPRIQAQYEKAIEPKELIVLPGSAHAQALFDTDQAARLMSEILRFLSAP